MIQVLLIGNGFDIAHGLPTKFTDFSKHILEEVLIPDLIKCVRDDDYSSNFFNEGLKSILHEDSFPISRPNNSLSKMIDLIVKNENNETQYKRFKHVLIDNKSIFLDYLENKLLLTLYKEESEYWFDIETTFYNQLIKIKDDTSTTKYGVSRKDKINRLNLEFSTIKHQLKEYLKKLKTKNEGPVKSFIQNFMHKAKVNGNSVVVIDFNYTSTILKIYDQNRHPFQHFPIHGTLDSEIVFGWGNDKDESYQEIKLLEDEFQKNFKTRQYSITPYYQKIYKKLVRAGENYHVHVLGHSLGLTDKTLLKEIFESKYCEYIYLYKRPDKYIKELSPNETQMAVEEEFNKLTIAAGRIIDDEMARIKIVNMTETDFFPYNPIQ